MASYNRDQYIDICRKILKDFGMRWGGWQEQRLDDVLVISQYMISTLEKPHDCGKMFTIAARRLKNLAGDTRNINESKMNLDS